MTAVGEIYIAYLRTRVKVHELREQGFEVEDISQNLNLHIRTVSRYLAAAKPILRQPDCNQSWREAAACKTTDSEYFFPSCLGLRAAKMKRRAKQICDGCPVKSKCHDTALANMECYGVWGGEDFSKYSYQFNPHTGEVTANVRNEDGSLKEVS